LSDWNFDLSRLTLIKEIELEMKVSRLMEKARQKP